jgi:predicted nucleic acid-binding protein
MRVLFDTNVILDVLQNRDPFRESSAAVLKLSESKKVSGSITTNMATDIYYILGRHIKNPEHTKSLIVKLLDAVIGK